MQHPRSSRIALATSGIVCCTLAFTIFGQANAKRDRAAALSKMMLISSVQGNPAIVNGMAPDIAWHDQTSGKLCHLSDLRGKPVILCFGSCTCGPFRAATNGVEQEYRRYAGRITCLLIYTQEAHPELAQETYMRDPKTREDRKAAACDLNQQLQITMPMLIDSLDNRAATEFEVRPSRIYALDRNGTIVFASRKSPASDMANGAVKAVDRMMSSTPIP